MLIEVEHAFFFSEKNVSSTGWIKEFLIFSGVICSMVIIVFLSIRNAFWNILGKEI